MKNSLIENWAFKGVLHLFSDVMLSRPCFLKHRFNISFCVPQEKAAVTRRRQGYHGLKLSLMHYFPPSQCYFSAGGDRKGFWIACLVYIHIDTDVIYTPCLLSRANWMKPLQRALTRNSSLIWIVFTFFRNEGERYGLFLKCKSSGREIGWENKKIDSNRH